MGEIKIISSQKEKNRLDDSIAYLLNMGSSEILGVCFTSPTFEKVETAKDIAADIKATLERYNFLMSERALNEVKYKDSVSEIKEMGDTISHYLSCYDFFSDSEDNFYDLFVATVQARPRSTLDSDLQENKFFEIIGNRLERMEELFRGETAKIQNEKRISDIHKLYDLEMMINLYSPYIAKYN